jgi:hypothetical protein
MLGFAGLFQMLRTFPTEQNVENTMKLTDDEKSEILKFIDSDKTLPEHYRTLLFDDKTEVGNPVSSANPQDSPWNPPSTTETQLMKRYGITKEGGRYCSGNYSYENLSDAMAYAEVIPAEASTGHLNEHKEVSSQPLVDKRVNTDCREQTTKKILKFIWIVLQVICWLFIFIVNPIFVIVIGVIYLLLNIIKNRR